ncbi:hypothetical protein GE09DRAFT_326650 [Coniochaeta sp. 2T2.1]|nr:hypothetical protein GE09DRAFT_326650 [Coniochaeta sp. 2T2.1]
MAVLCAALHWFLESPTLRPMQVPGTPGTNTADPALSRLGAIDHRVHHFVITDEHVSIGDQHAPCPQTRVSTTETTKAAFKRPSRLVVGLPRTLILQDLQFKVSACIN